MLSFREVVIFMATSKDSHTISYIPQTLNMSFPLALGRDSNSLENLIIIFLVGIIRKTNYIFAYSTMLVCNTSIFYLPLLC